MFLKDSQYSQSYKLTRRFGTSYFYSALLLNKCDRQHIYALYSLCRYADDLVDVADGKPGTASTAKEDLSKFRDDVFTSISRQYDEPDLLGAISVTWNELNLPLEYLERFFSSMEMDLTVTSYDTFDDLLVYMDGSAAVIGEMVLPIIETDSTKHESLKNSARALGNAFQLTNFLRDVGEDRLRNRTYIPLKDFADFGIDPKDFKFDASFRKLMKFEIERNKKLYVEAFPGVVALKGRRGACVRTAYRLYGGILNEIASNSYDSINQRARLSKTKKIATALRELMRFSSNSFKPDLF